MAVSGSAKRVLVVLMRYESWQWECGNAWVSFARLADEIHRTIKETRRAVYELRDAGLVEYSVMADPDGIPHGSGYFLTGKAVIR